MVVFGAGAERDLDAIDDYISADSPDRALAFVRRIKVRCLALADFPHVGRVRRELGRGVRLVGFQRRVAIIYRVTGDRIVILRVLYGGRALSVTRKPD